MGKVKKILFNNSKMNAETNVFVTGANGLLGCNTIIELLKCGFHVKGLLRSRGKYNSIKHENLELIEGDITNKEYLDEVLFNCEYVIHLAAITDQNLLNYNLYEEINVIGTKNILLAAIKNKVRRIIYVSTANVFGFGPLNNLGDETKKMKHPFDKSFYANSKKEGQDFALSKINEIEVVIVNPTFMIGPYGSRPSSGKIILMGLKNPYVFCPPGGKNFVCAKDVAKGIIRAMKYGVNGEAYLLANENITFCNFFKLLRRNTKNNFLIIHVPKYALLLLGYIGNLIRSIGIKTNFSDVNMKALCINNYYSNNKAKKQFEINFNPIEEGIIEAIEWYSKTK